MVVRIKIKVENLHIHYSHIEFTAKGEKKHVPNTNSNWGPKIDPLFQIIKDNGFQLNYKKVRGQYKTKRQEVTGLTVNQMPQIFVRLH